MNIIMGTDQAQLFKEKYTVLELDTFKIMPSGQHIPAYCVVENIPILDLAKIDNMSRLHNGLIENYRKKNWNYCTQALEHLVGFWGGELDTFYADLQSRITKYLEQDPGDEWDGTIEKHSVSQ